MVKLVDGDITALVPTEALLMEMWRYLPAEIQQRIVEKLFAVVANGGFPVATIAVARIMGPDGQMRLPES